MESSTPFPPNTMIRAYSDSDYEPCRSLWLALTEHHRRLYGDPTIGGVDPGAGFDAYLARPERVGTWVAVVNEEVVGLTGLLDHGNNGEVEPVVVAERLRGRQIGTQLLNRVIQDAAERKLEYLAIRPVARNISAIRSFHAVGFRTLGAHVDLTMDLTERRHRWLSGERLHNLDFQY